MKHSLKVHHPNERAGRNETSMCSSLQDFYKFYEVTGLKWKVTALLHTYDGSVCLLLVYMSSVCVLQARRSGEHWFDDLPHTTFLIFKGTLSIVPLPFVAVKNVVP